MDMVDNKYDTDEASQKDSRAEPTNQTSQFWSRAC